MVPHLGHTALMAVVIAAGVCVLGMGQRKKTGKTINSQMTFAMGFTMHPNGIGLQLTFARIHAFGPPVINIFVAKSAAVLEPSTARSATTGSAGFQESAALWASYRVSGGHRSDYELSFRYWSR